MISFPSTLYTAGRSVISNLKKNHDLDKFANREDSKYESISYNLDDNYNYTLSEKNQLQLIITNGKAIIQTDSAISIEDPLKMSLDVINEVNNYNYPFANPIRTVVEKTVGGDEVVGIETYQVVTQSLFNPVNTVKIEGMTSNVPLMNIDKNEVPKDLTFPYTYDEYENDISGNIIRVNEGQGSSVNLHNYYKNHTTDTSDCSISKLVELSKAPTGDNDHTGYRSELGRARYKYADFMYCEDLGKIPNNQLITLRRFPMPIGDDIFRNSTDPQGGDDPSNNIFYQPFDVARMITWFGTEDNKLEKILTYSVQSTFVQKDSKVETVDSQAYSDNSIVGQLANLFSPDYVRRQVNGYGQANDSLTRVLGGPFNIFRANGQYREYYEKYVDGMGDENKIYSPLNTVQSTHLYEGNLKFNQSIELTFKYKLRAYNNINPKSAFLDLLANILVCTYRRGKFWGGDRRLIGPRQNENVFKVANAFIDEGVDAVGGFIGGLLNGGMSLDLVKSLASELGKNLFGAVSNFASGITGEAQSQFGGWELILDLGTRFFKGALKNKFGRPQLYMMNSLLSGADVGFWHLTVGNPRNPIAVMGNLIMEDATITHQGPLGIDDFPTELVVTVKLKPGRPRDLNEIERMYTKGTSGIYFDVMDSIKKNDKKIEGLDKYYSSDRSSRYSLENIFGESNLDVISKVLIEMH